MRKNIKISVSMIVFCLNLFSKICFGQDIPTTNTHFSRIETGSIGKENFSFSLSNLNLTITDVDNNRTEIYGPLK